MQDWKDAEKEVKKQFEKEGYTVLNQNDNGFPYLIVVKDGKIIFFIEVKAMLKFVFNSMVGPHSLRWCCRATGLSSHHLHIRAMSSGISLTL